MEMSAGRPQNILRTYFYRYWHKHTVRVFSLNAYKDESVVRFLRCLHISKFFFEFLTILFTQIYYLFYCKLYEILLREKCPYSKFIWPVFSPNAGKYDPEKLRIRRLFTQYVINIVPKSINNNISGQCFILNFYAIFYLWALIYSMWILSSPSIFCHYKSLFEKRQIHSLYLKT